MANYQDRQIHEECGVFGVFGVEKAASLTYYGLHSLQHRGQEGCGIVSVDNRTFHRVKGEAAKQYQERKAQKEAAPFERHLAF